MKKLVFGSLIAALVISGGIGINALANDDIILSKVQSDKLIGIEKAKQVALKEANGTVESVELEKSNGKTFYEIDINGEKSKEYEVRVDAFNAKVLNVREDKEDQDDNDDGRDKITSNTKLITEAKAIEIAQKQIKGTLLEIELDFDDGRYEYELELNTTKGKAEITIDATTGKILDYELDNDDRDDDK